jgi:hypothetical protein
MCQLRAPRTDAAGKARATNSTRAACGSRGATSGAPGGAGSPIARGPARPRAGLAQTGPSVCAPRDRARDKACAGQPESAPGRRLLPLHHLRVTSTCPDRRVFSESGSPPWRALQFGMPASISLPPPMCVANGALFASLPREQSSSRLLVAAVAFEHDMFGVVQAARNFSRKIRVHKALEGRVRRRTTPLF